MVVLNLYEEIAPICISHKLGLYIANLPQEEHNNWRDSLAKQLELAVSADKAYQNMLGSRFPCRINNLYNRLFPNELLPQDFDIKHYTKIADKMICIYLNYDYDDMPLGGWDTNCFDGRLCEEDYAEKIIELINFLTHGENDVYDIPTTAPQWIYSSNYDTIDHYRIFWTGNLAGEYIDSLIKWGEIFDQFLQNRNDYLLFDYIANSIHKDNAYNEYHLMKSFSLCQLFLEKEKEKEEIFDSKLANFLDSRYSAAERKSQATFYRQMRNKIAHGDFLAFEKKVEEYAVEHMDETFSFDYSEFSRKNWVVQHVCCALDEVVRQLICMAIFDKVALTKTKNGSDA